MNEEIKHCKRCGLILSAYTEDGICHYCTDFSKDVPLYISPKDPGSISLTSFPPRKWQWSLTDSKDFVVHVYDAPNWFHRFMQRLILGIVWKRK